MKQLAVIASRGSLNSLVQVVTLAMAAAVSDVAVRILFRDEAVVCLSQDRIDHLALSPVYDEISTEVLARYAAGGLSDPRQLIHELKSLGDVRLYVCASSLHVAGLRQEDLIPEIDETRGLVSFLLEDVADADHVLTF